MTEALQVTYDGISVSYDEAEDKWSFTIRGRERSAPSLAKAKEFIDRPVKDKEASTFTPLAAYYVGYDHAPREIQVTSMAEGRSYSSGQHYWIVKDGQRRKERCDYIYPQSPSNVEAVTQMRGLEKQIKTLQKQLEKAHQSMEKLVVKDEEIPY